MRVRVYADFASLVLRVSIGLMMLVGHGLPKWPKVQAAFQGEEVAFFSLWGLSPALSVVLAGFAEIVCAALIILGLRTRWTVVPMIFTMFVAAFIVHGDHAWLNALADGGRSKEMALLYLVPLITIWLLGSGKYSLDAAIDRR